MQLIGRGGGGGGGGAAGTALRMGRTRLGTSTPGGFGNSNFGQVVSLRCVTLLHLFLLSLVHSHSICDFPKVGFMHAFSPFFVNCDFVHDVSNFSALI